MIFFIYINIIQKSVSFFNGIRIVIIQPKDTYNIEHVYVAINNDTKHINTFYDFAIRIIA